MTTTTTDTTATAATVDPDAAVHLVEVDPRTLAAHPTNIRSDLGNLADLTRSVRAVGILEPLIITPATIDGDGEPGWRIIAGHRRNAAAIDADLGTVPCVVRADLAGAAAAQIAAMFVENTQRVDLSAAERSAAIGQLCMLGLSDTAIGRATGTTRGQVRKHRTVADSETAQRVAVHAGLTLEAALLVAEFEDDHDAVKAIVACAVDQPRRLDHLASRLRQDRDDAAAHAARITELTGAGHRIIDPDADDTDTTSLHRLSSLTDAPDDADERPGIDAGDHADCPGHVGIVDRWNHEHVAWYCDQPNQHQPRWNNHQPDTAQPGGPMTEEQKAERRTVIANNKAWDAATPVRGEWISRLIGRKTPPTGTLRYVTGEIMTSPDLVSRGSDEDLAALTGRTSDGPSWERTVAHQLVEAATDKALPLVLLAQWAAAIESDMGRHTWRHSDTRAARWLNFLAGTGYELAEIEQHIIDHAER
jgi:ParB family chromosome partitioning protein